MELTLRPGRPEDADVCGLICYEALTRISKDHNFTPDLSEPEGGIRLVSSLLAHPGFYSVVAELRGKVVGSNFLDERNCISGVGPITVDPAVQDKAIGRRLMEAVMARAASKKAPGVRLVQAAFHSRSLSLYAKVGFDIREPLVCLQGPALRLKLPGYQVRIATEADLPACEELCHRIHGFDRGGELRDTIRQGIATVVEHDGRISGYASVIGFFGHAVGCGNIDLQALIGQAQTFAGSGFLLPSRNTELFRWCLQHGLRVQHSMTLMSFGFYNDPAGAFLPSVVY